MIAMTSHAFVDESKRGQTYLVAAAVVDPAHLVAVRRDLRGLLLPGQRELHFAKEKPRRRRALADSVARLPIAVRIYSAQICGNDERARACCMESLIRDLAREDGRRLVIDSREERDKLDERVIRDALGKHPSETALVYEHAESGTECLLWIADIVGWCYGAGGEWRRRVAPVISAATTRPV